MVSSWLARHFSCIHKELLVYQVCAAFRWLCYLVLHNSFPVAFSCKVASLFFSLTKKSWHLLSSSIGWTPHILFFVILLPETGGICIAPRPSEEKAEIVPAMAMRPFFGIVPVLMDENVS